MSAKMEERIKNEENVTKLVRNELAVMEDEIKNLKMSGSGSTVCSEEWDWNLLLSPGRRHSLLVGMKLFVPRKMEFKGRVTDYTKNSIEGITNDEVLILVRDLERMVPRINWDQTRTGQSRLQYSRAEREGEARSQSSEKAFDRSASFVGLKEMKRDGARVKTIHGKLQICFFLGGKASAAKYTREGEGHAEEGWVINLLVVLAICADVGDALFDTLV